MKELVTIIINVYNCEKYIKKCLDSIVNQTYKNLEILIINDGSTDNTLHICKSYKDKRIKIKTTKNQGLSLSRNVGIDNAKGEYLYFIDADDFIEKDTIEYLYNLCKKYNAEMAICECKDIYDYNSKISCKKEKKYVLSNEEMIKELLLNTINHVDTTWNKLIKKELFNNIRFENRIINDLTTTYKFIISAKKIIYSNQVKYYYYRNRNSITMTKKHDFKRNKEIYKVIIERYKDIKRIYPNLIENDINLLRNIVMLYSRNNNELKVFLNKVGAKELFKQKYTLKI